MPTLFATEDVPIGEHAIDDVFVTHSGPDHLATCRTNCYIQPRVAHHRGHQSVLGQSSFSQHLQGANGHNVVAIDQTARFVTKDHPVGIPIMSNTQVGPILANLATNRLRVH